MTSTSSDELISASTINSTQSPGTRLPNEILTLIFQLAQPPIPKRALSGPNDYYTIWKSYYTLPLVCRDWKSSAESCTRSILVIQSHSQIEKILKAFEMGYLDNKSTFKSLIFDIKVIGEIESEESMLLLFQYLSPTVEQISNIGFGLRTVVGYESDRMFDSLQIISMNKLKKFTYNPIDEHAALASTSLLLVSLGITNPDMESFDLSISHNYNTLPQVYDQPDLQIIGKKLINFSMLSLFYGTLTTILLQNVTSITLRGINTILTNLFILLKYPPQHIHNLQLLELTLTGEFNHTIHNLLDPIFKPEQLSNIQQFTFSTTQSSVELPTDILWSIISSYKVLTHLIIDDVDLVNTLPNELASTLVEITLGSQYIPEVGDFTDLDLWIPFFNLNLCNFKDLIRISIAIPFDCQLPDFVLVAVENYSNDGVQLIFPTLSSPYDDYHELEGSVDLRKEWWGDNI